MSIVMLKLAIHIEDRSATSVRALSILTICHILVECIHFAPKKRKDIFGRKIGWNQLDSILNLYELLKTK